MAFDPSSFVRTLDLRKASELQLRLVSAWRCLHIARLRGGYHHHLLLRHLGSLEAIRPFHALSDEIIRAWPEPFAFHRPSQFYCTFDEILLLDMTDAAATADRTTFDQILADMVHREERDAIWQSARQLMLQFA